MVASHTLVIPWLLGSILVARFPEARRDPRPAGAADEVATCIRRAAQGRAWLEKTLWGLREQEGGWIGAEVRNVDGSYDLGPLQVNSWWVARVSRIVGRPAWQVRYWLANDACFNVDVARWIFLSGLAVTRDYWRAVGVYHSPSGWRQRRYARLVAAKLAIRYGPSVFQTKVIPVVQ